VGVKLKYNENDIILKEGKIDTKMYVVLKGTVVLYMNYGKDNEYVLGACGVGKVFGEMGLLCKEESMYTAVAFTDAEVMRFGRDNLEHFFTCYPKNAIGMMEKIARCNSLLKMNLDLAIDEMKSYADKLEELQVEPMENKTIDVDEMKKQRAIFSTSDAKNLDDVIAKWRGNRNKYD